MPSPRLLPESARLGHARAPLVLHALAACALSGLAGCAVYAPKQLHPRPAPEDAATLSIPAKQMPVPALRTHRFDPSDGLDVTETAMLAVANSPRLRVMRDRLGVARAQAFAAGLLPDPQLSGSRDVSTGGAPDLSRGFSLGLDYDLGALLTRSARKAGARAGQRQVRLQLLWAEWQTIARARLLFDRVQSLRARQRRLAHEKRLMDPMRATIDTALKQGNLDYAVADTGLNAVAGVRNRLEDVRRRREQAGHALRALLGLAPTAPLHLVGPAWQPRPTAAAIARAGHHLARQRPDLLALKAGYAAQEAKVRTAILGQFPDIQVGFSRARDTSGVFSNSLGVSLNLPLFNANRGRIAVARATRRQLADAYRARVLATRNDMHRLTVQLHSLDRQILAARDHARRLDAASRAATARWRQGLLVWTTWLSVRAGALDADLTLDSLRQKRARASIALETLLGGDWTDHAPPSPTTSTNPADHRS